MESYISSEFPSLTFTTVEAAKDFAEKLGLEAYKVVEYLFLSNDEQTTTLIGYAIIYKERLFR